MTVSLYFSTEKSIDFFDKMMKKGFLKIIDL